VLSGSFHKSFSRKENRYQMKYVSTQIENRFYQSLWTIEYCNKTLLVTIVFRIVSKFEILYLRMKTWGRCIIIIVFIRLQVIHKMLFFSSLRFTAK